MKGLISILILSAVSVNAYAFDSSFEWVSVKSKDRLGYAHLQVRGDFGPLSVIDGYVEGYLPVHACLDCGWIVGDFGLVPKSSSVSSNQGSIDENVADLYYSQTTAQIGHIYQMSLYQCPLPTGVGLIFSTQDSFKSYLKTCNLVGQSPSYTVTRKGLVFGK